MPHTKTNCSLQFFPLRPYTKEFFLQNRHLSAQGTRHPLRRFSLSRLRCGSTRKTAVRAEAFAPCPAPEKGRRGGARWRRQWAKAQALRWVS